ncbi:MAG: hypothetical protein HKN91_08670 [Acidimicrobiia bacterium]|nr:hypothetical protein [Acidimicrobiia bacterium]
MAKTSRSSNGPGVGAVSVVSGSIRTAEDPTALDVKISIWDTEVTMRADGAELGHWPAQAVTVTPIDAFTFEFIAEGDRLVFTPNDPDEFKQLPIVAGSSKGKRKRRSKGSDKKAPAAPALRWDEESQAELDLRKRRTKTEKQKEPRPSRQERKSAARKAQQERAVRVPVVDHDNAVSKAPKPVRREPAPSHEPVVKADFAVDTFEAPVERPAKERKPLREKVTKPRQAREVKSPIGNLRKPRLPKRQKPDTNGHSRIADLRHRAWISSLDYARQFDLFGLDRVPVHLEQRDDPNHQHTWDHRVAPAGGPGSFICTLCGAFKKRSG